MTEHPDRSDWKSSSRGDAAWKEATDRVASRNAEARKLGKREREDVRRAAAAKRHAQLLRRRSP